MPVEPGSIGPLRAQEIASETERIDAESVAFMTASANQAHPMITEQKVVRIPWARFETWMADALGLAQVQVTGMESFSGIGLE